MVVHIITSNKNKRDMIAMLWGDSVDSNHLPNP